MRRLQTLFLAVALASAVIAGATNVGAFEPTARSPSKVEVRRDLKAAVNRVIRSYKDSADVAVRIECEKSGDPWPCKITIEFATSNETAPNRAKVERDLKAAVNKVVLSYEDSAGITITVECKRTGPNPWDWDCKVTIR